MELYKQDQKCTNIKKMWKKIQYYKLCESLGFLLFDEQNILERQNYLNIQNPIKYPISLYETEESFLLNLQATTATITQC